MPIEWNEQEMEDFIRRAYQENFDLLRLETGVALTPEVKQAGLLQVLFYWRKMRAVAEKVTDTEVRLSLPGNTSPAGRVFGIEGIVDIVREGEKTIIYDIKTHNAEYVRSHIDLYEDQLNVYAHIWKELQKQRLDGTALICTEFPPEIKDALDNGDDRQLEHAFQTWQPLIEIAFDSSRVDATIQSFADVVDKIEGHFFGPPPLEKLQEPYAGHLSTRFGTHVCRNCDARFSCDAYRVYARQGRGRAEEAFSTYFSELEAGEPLEEWRTAGLESIPELGELV